MMLGEFERGIDNMMMLDEFGGYIDDMMMPSKSERGFDVIMMSGESRGYINDMVMPFEFVRGIDVMMMPGESGGHIDLWSWELVFVCWLSSFMWKTAAYIVFVYLVQVGHFYQEEDDVEEHDLYAQPRRGHANGGDMYKIKDEIPTFNGNVNIEGFLDWIYEVEAFFEIMNILPDHRVPLMAYKLKGEEFLRLQVRCNLCENEDQQIARSMGRSPFSIMYTRVSRHVVDLVNLSTRENSRSVMTFGKNYSEFFKEVQDVLEASNKKYKQLAEKNRRLISFQVDDQLMVYLRKERLPTGVHEKLRQKKYCPYTILKKINKNAYVVDFPSEMNISNTFNVADLSLYHPEQTLYEENSRSSFKEVEENDEEH
ncbi:hypothetical protein CQW23_18480 [Capsicum baccatum]|uniref:Tf2-1-like SH3-like domain-containing protein n=1 Tax=Capsicum baccatum TaxID=33114 RepID=A0A2G2W313_CAPBA|nr:hypothetical protein CQW23_18480 [Capsicum baccatum]